MHFTFAQYQESAQFLKHRLGNFQPKVRHRSTYCIIYTES